MKQLTATLDGVEEDVAQTRRELAKLIAEKKETLEEMRKGLFCSGCNQTKSQILAKGEEFPHSGQHIIPADPKQLQAAEKDFDQRIAALKKKLAALEAKLSQKAELDAAHFEFMIRKPVYHAHFAREQYLRMREWANEKAGLEAQLTELEESVRTAEEALKKAKDSGETARLENLRRHAAAGASSAREAAAQAKEAAEAASRQVEEIDARLKAATQSAEQESLRATLTRGRAEERRIAAEAGAAETKAAELEAKARAAEAAVKAHAARLELLETNLRVLQRQFADSLAKARSAQRRAEQRAQSYVQAALKNLDETAAVAAPLPGKFGIPTGWFLSETIRNCNPPIQCRIALLDSFDAASRRAGLRDRLETAPASPAAPSSSKAKKSMRELLEGK